MKIYKQNKNIKIKNINNSFNNRYKRQYSFCGIKFTVKNKEKIEFYKRKKEEIRRKKYEPIIEEMNSLKKFHNDDDYIITCCITTYNHEATIAKCIESILAQKTQYKYIIKIFDDCSTDDTVEICSEYARKYPDKIEYVLQPVNTKAKQASAFFRNIKTKYYTCIDGDDYWCNENKLEMGINFLENHPDYVIWAHDTLFKNEITGNEYSYVHAHLGFKEINNPVTYDNFVYLHLSARIHRNVIDWETEYIRNRKRDIFIYHATLDKGLMYYHNEIMSVYTFSKNGVFSKLSHLESRYSNFYSYYTINKYLSFRHDNYFSAAVGSNIKLYKKIFGKKLGWAIFMIRCRNKILKKILDEKRASLDRIEHGHQLFSEKEYKQIVEIANQQ